MGAGVSFQVEGIIESFAAEGAQVSLDIRVALHMPVQESLQRETFRTQVADELGRIVRIGHALRLRRGIRFGTVLLDVLVDPVVRHERVLDSVAAVHEFDGRIARQAELQRNILFITITENI